MPKKIGPLFCAAKIHELVFESDRKIKKKNLPNEAFYQSVKIKIGRMIVRRRDEVEPEGEMPEMEVDDLNDVILEPRRDSLSSRRRQAAYEDVLKSLDNNFDFDE